jgi:hypothetical protein
MYGETPVRVISIMTGMLGFVTRIMPSSFLIVLMTTEWIDLLSQSGFMDISLTKMEWSSQFVTRPVNASKIGLMLSWIIAGMVSIHANRENRDSLRWYISQLILIG